MLYLKPKDGSQVRRPDGTLLPSRGAHVPNTSYWRRRLKAGDCETIGAPQGRKSKPAPTDKKVKDKDKDKD